MKRDYDKGVLLWILRNFFIDHLWWLVLVIAIDGKNSEKYLLQNSIENIKAVIRAILLKQRSYKFSKFNRKVFVLESLLNKVANLQACNLLKKRLQVRCFPLKFTRFLEHLFWNYKIIFSYYYLFILAFIFKL